MPDEPAGGEVPEVKLPKAGSSLALRNWRVRTRLIALIAVPTIVAVVFGGLRVTSSISGAEQAQVIGEVGRLVTQFGEVSRDLGLERDLATRYAASGRSADVEGRLAAQQEVVDVSVKRVLSTAQTVEPSLSDIGRRSLDRIKVRLDQLGSLRETVTKTQMPPLPTMEKYSETIAEMLQLYDEVAQGATDEQLIATSAALRAIARAEEEASKQRALLTIGLVRGSFLETEFSAFLDANSRRDSERAAFLAVATLDQRQAFDNTVASVKIGRAELYIDRSVLLHTNAAGIPSTSSARGQYLRRLDTSTNNDVDRWFDAISETVDRFHDVQKSLGDQVATRSADLASGDRQLAAINISIVGALLVLVLAITAIMAGSLVRPLRRLRGDALKIAGQTLPDLVRQLRTTDVDPERLSVPPIEINSKDEIGEVARAFDEVHREAIRLAGEESRLRSNVNAMFVNLSRRSQTLVERQITLIDGLEQGEQDEQRLGNLFKLDHLATRMRRNSENLLVLAGQEPPRRWSQPVKLVDVARASLSEVENYERVVLEVPEGVSIAGQAVNDVIHLLAELIENALSFSPRETRVPVSGSRIDGGGIMLSISDSGIGMAQEELIQANERLIDSPTVDVAVSRRMGLFVVARLAHRHGIRVQLRSHGSGGLTAMVLIPESLLGAQAPSFAGSQPAGAGAGGAPPRGGVFPTPQPAAASPWPASGYQLGPGHPSYPSEPAPQGTGTSWPSVPQWPAEAGNWMSNNSAPSSDVWVSSRGPSTGETALPRRGAPPEEQRAWSQPVEQPPAPTSQRYEFPETESAATGPIPVVKPASAGDEYLPIFASVESAWFEHGTDSGATWGSAKADAGWSAAQAAVEPARDGSTAAGLPKRVPKANLVPGSADAVSAPKGVAPMPAVSPDRIRSRLSSFQQGFRAARDDISEGRTFGSGPRSNSREEGA
ncbi:nitrate- and nitrite sensing domain-containing protein [Nonomuraea basaltis]|uniref:sensor histidine kinase n=1 Tax=Nonomuraea basaltis TaxID=2495887 RepID=UPI00110C497C|nr:nitrate- and nitrite sensing domain-containing protein [Nonomuraea basaltis]TMR90267.1 HAMP domain-containing protein [Nonomuraea basaltis]